MTLKLVSVLREFTLEDKSTPDNANFVFDSYVNCPTHGLVHFARKIEDSQQPWVDTTVVMNGSQVVGSGEDPRAFLWRDSPCISAAFFNPGHGFINKIYILSENRWLTLLPPDNLDAGKNWSPFVKDGDLYFVHGFSPFRVFKARMLHENDGFLLLDTVAEHEMPTRKADDNYTRLRGGSNALQFGDLIVGVGHTNDRIGPKVHTNTYHRPFFFVYRPDKSLAYYECAFDFPERYRIVDPTSFYEKDGKLFLVTCETEQVWHHTPQQGRICLYELERPGDDNEDSFGFGGRRIHRWPDGQPSKIRRLLGAWRRS
ncbi:hypothetical protein NBRC116590_13050 [Pelagimonas sp. KU-00592-HH]|uniref:hypothetical protein n=1 Tax=Pelagimonas sp. KU-00592-HH TaxID=3127651 RepID=UPI00310A8B7C